MNKLYTLESSETLMKVFGERERKSINNRIVDALSRYTSTGACEDWHRSSALLTLITQTQSCLASSPDDGFSNFMGNLSLSPSPPPHSCNYYSNFVCKSWARSLASSAIKIWFLVWDFPPKAPFPTSAICMRWRTFFPPPPRFIVLVPATLPMWHWGNGRSVLNRFSRD